MSASQREVNAPKNRLGRIVFFAAFAGLVLWGASLYQQRYPVGFEIRYVYRGLPDAALLKSVRATLTSGRKIVSVIRFFHPEPLAVGALEHILQGRFHDREVQTAVVRGGKPACSRFGFGSGVASTTFGLGFLLFALGMSSQLGNSPIDLLGLQGAPRPQASSA